MKKFNTAPISGTQELLPGLQSQFDKFKNEILAVFHQHGFLSIETPIIDRQEILLAKAGGDTEKQIYKVIKTTETADDADQALRFDHTVPLARYVAEHANDLTFPFKVTQVGRNFRGERPQKGRLREFYQCDVDVIGREELALAYDVEVIVTLMQALAVLPLPSLLVRVSNRKILSGLIQELGLMTKSAAIFSIIDHAEKVPAEKTRAAFEEEGLSNQEIEILENLMAIQGTSTEVRQQLEALGMENETFRLGVAELLAVLERLEQRLAKSPHTMVTADLKIVRGLDYYTGTVFETVVPEYREIGSVCSGGRYENLSSHYTEQKFPGVGGSIGLTRLFVILREYGLLEATKPIIDYAILPISAAEVMPAEELAEKLRSQGKTADVVLTNKKLGDKLKYAAKIAHYAVVVGEDEIKTGVYQAKNLESGETIAL